jgi:hypothetical protein
MAWTTPNTINTGDVASATDHNTYIRDNLNYLLQRPTGSVNRSGSSDYSYATGAWADIDATNLKVDVTTASGRLLIVHMGIYAGNTGGAVLGLDLSIDGTRVAAATAAGLVKAITTSAVYGSSQGLPITLQWLATGLSVGSHTIKIMWYAFSGTIYLYNNALNVTLQALEV